MAIEEAKITRLPLPKGCECCHDEDGPLVLTARCHPSSGVFAVLTGNVLTLECAECRNIVTRLEVTCQVQLG